MNLKKLATWLWKSDGSKHPIRDFVSQLMKTYKKLPSPQNETRKFGISLIYISLGTNIEPRAKYLKYSSELLEQYEIRIIKKSSIDETAPVGFTEQANFLNMVVEVDIFLSAIKLLDECQAI